MVCLHKGWQIGQTFLPQSSHQGQTPKQKRKCNSLLHCNSLERVKSSSGNENPKFLISFSTTLTLAITLTSKGWIGFCITLALLKKLVLKSNRLVALDRRCFRISGGLSNLAAAWVRLVLLWLRSLHYCTVFENCLASLIFKIGFFWPISQASSGNTFWPALWNETFWSDFQTLCWGWIRLPLLEDTGLLMRLLGVLW